MKIQKMIQQKMMADYQRRLRLQEFEALHGKEEPAEIEKAVKVELAKNSQKTEKTEIVEKVDRAEKVVDKVAEKVEKIEKLHAGSSGEVKTGV